MEATPGNTGEFSEGVQRGRPKEKKGTCVQIESREAFFNTTTTESDCKSCSGGTNHFSS